MDKDYMEEWKKKREAKRNEEKRRLLAISDVESWNLVPAEWYQRMRYQREIEAHEYIQELRRKNPVRAQEPVKQRYAKSKSNQIYFD